MCRQASGSFATCNTPAVSNGDVPTVADTEFLDTLAIDATSAALSGNSMATTAAGVDLTFILTPTYAASDASIVWTMTGTICEPVRGLPNGKGGCP